MEDRTQEIKTAEGKLLWEKKSKRFHRYRVAMSDININVVGTLYFGVDIEELPERLILERIER